MNQYVLAAQLYTVRQFTQTAQDFAASMKKIREMGYRAVQISAIGPIPPAEVKAILDGEGVMFQHLPFRFHRHDPAGIEQSGDGLRHGRILRTGACGL